MEKIETFLVLEKETKNTYRYQEKPGKVPALRTLYVQKWAIGSNPPKEIKVTVEEIRGE